MLWNWWWKALGVTFLIKFLIITFYLFKDRDRNKDQKDQKVQKFLEKFLEKPYFIIFLLERALLGPALEEIIFRSFLIFLKPDHLGWTFCIIQGIIFGMVHPRKILFKINFIIEGVVYGIFPLYFGWMGFLASYLLHFSTNFFILGLLSVISIIKKTIIN